MCVSCGQQNMTLSECWLQSSTSVGAVRTMVNRSRKHPSHISKIRIKVDKAPNDDTNNNNSNNANNNNNNNNTKKRAMELEDARTMKRLMVPVDTDMGGAPPCYLPNLPSDFSNFRKVKRSYSFGGFGVFSSGVSFGGISFQEIESMFDPVSNKEPSKTSKKQIKEYAKKYKHVNEEDNKRLPWYRDPLEYTQPAHVVTCIAFLYLAFRLFPDARKHPREACTLTRLLYVSSISAVFGAQFWMTFISGLALFFSIPRHMFARVQGVLFPLYFMTNAALTLITIVTFTQHNPTHLWDTHQTIQGGILVLGFFINLGIRLYLAPILTKLITLKIAIESEAGLGGEIRSNEPGVLAKCPHYMRLYTAFRRTHIAIAIGNMASMAGTSWHLYYLATKLCVSQL